MPLRRKMCLQSACSRWILRNFCWYGLGFQIPLSFQMTIARVQIQWTSHRTGPSCWVHLLFTSTILFLPEEEQWLSMEEEVNGQPCLDVNVDVLITSPNMKMSLLRMISLFQIISFSFPSCCLFLLFPFMILLVFTPCIQDASTMMSSAFTHRTGPINPCVELLPDPHIVSCSDLFLSSPNDSRLFFLGVADGVVAPPEMVSPCMDPESPLSFNLSFIVLLLFLRVAHVIKKHKCHWKSDLLNLFFFFVRFDSPALFLYG